MNLVFGHDPDWPWPYERFAETMRGMGVSAPSVEQYDEMVKVLDVLWPDIVSDNSEMHPDAAQLYREILTPELRKDIMKAAVSEFGGDPAKADVVFRELEETIESPLRNQKPSFFP